MLFSDLLLLLAPLLSIPTLTLQVDIILSRQNAVRQECTHIPPGVCCQIANPRYYIADTVTVHHLLAGYIAAVWDSQSQPNDLQPIRGCTGAPVETHIGPSQNNPWIYDIRDYDPTLYLRGASYISLPQNLPPSGSDAQWLMAEGLRALVWGGGQWFANQAGASTLSQVHSKRGIVSANKGTAYITAPFRWQYPDLIAVNGTNYTDDGRGDLVYRSEDGMMLNLDGLGG